jgi:cell wall-associated NlpC family hydrolase
MRMHRPPRSFLVALTLLAAVAACAGAAVAGAPAATRTARIAAIEPVPSPLSVPPVLEAAAQRLEAEAAAAKPRARKPSVAPKRSTTQTVHPEAAPSRGDASDDPALVTADVLENGIALPPLDSPSQVRAIIEAGNAIARTPYKWGGGHGRWQDTGYDCSGSVSFALASAGLLSGPLASGPLMSWGEPGRGKWITVWSNTGHVFLEVAGVRFDTSGTRVTGSRWQATMRSTAGFVARHPAGL